MREITSHHVPGTPELVRVLVLDEPGTGGANHRYQIEHVFKSGCKAILAELSFQAGPVHKAGINGITNETLLAIVEDRLVGFQNGQFPCGFNSDALQHVQLALRILLERTANRVARGVEGHNQL